jgi:L-iditol 2-dehydrogenase
LGSKNNLKIDKKVGSKMKAVVFKEEGKSNLLDVEIPEINENQILLKVNSCGICGSDLKFEEGTSVKIDKEGKKRSMEYPMITGHEFSGTVVEVGENVSGYKIGDRLNIIPNLPCGQCYYCQIGHHEMCDNEKVFGYDYNGAFAEYLAVPERAIRLNAINKLSDNVSSEEATFAEPIAVSINCQNRSEIKPGDTVLIVGAGPIGCINIQLAKFNGAKKIIAVEISDKRLEFAERFGADVLINPQRGDVVENVRKETGGNGADKIILCCGSHEMQEKSVQMTNKLGIINYFASLSHFKPDITINANLIHYREIIVTGTHNSTPLQNKLAYDLIERGVINVKDLITDRFALDDYYKGIETAKSGKGMKVIINI